MTDPWGRETLLYARGDPCYTDFSLKLPMENQHPITPPPELVQQWVAEIWHEGTEVRVALSDEHIATRAAKWGADQQLEKDAEWLDANALFTNHLTITPSGDALRQVMRPKPPSLKKQALAIFKEKPACSKELIAFDTDQVNIIREALEALPE